MKAATAWLAAVATLLAACGRQNPAPVPRRTAYPRPPVIDTVMQPADSLPVRFEVNTAATLSRPRPGWLDIAYPMYGATVHVTFTEASGSELDRARANRLQRADLNTGGLPTLRDEWISPAGFDILTLRTDGCATPFQFLATDGHGIVISGAVYFRSPAAVTATDSVAPMLRTITRDLTRALNTLSTQ